MHWHKNQSAVYVFCPLSFFPRLMLKTKQKKDKSNMALVK
jgi:hypothetical protein